MTLALTLLVPLLAGVILVVLDGRRRAVAWAAVAALVATAAVLALLAADVLAGGATQIVTGGWPVGVGIVLRADALSVAFALVSLLSLLAASIHQVSASAVPRMLPGLLVLLGAGMTGLFLAGDLFNFYVFFELAMTTSYVLTTAGGGGRQLRAAVIFAAVNLVGSFVFLLAVAGTYRLTATLAMVDVAAAMPAGSPAASRLIAVGFLIAFSIKLGLFPFSFWLPTVYTHARPAVAAVLSGALANIGAYGVLRFGVQLFPDALASGATALVLVGSVSILYGAVLAIGRREVTGVLAYSAIGQVGYVFVAVGVGGPVGLAAAVTYAVVKSLNETLLFLVAGLRGALVGAAFVVGALSVAGVPPAAGFVAKLVVLRAGIAADRPALVALVGVGGVLSLIYLFQLHHHHRWHGDGGAAPSPLPVRAPALALAAVVLAAGAWPEPLLALSREAAGALVGGS